MVKKHSILNIPLTIEEKLTEYRKEYESQTKFLCPNGIDIDHIKQNKKLSAKIPMIKDI